jgi:predicted permease
MINGTSLTVIGVAPKEFRGLVAGISPDLWVPFMMAPSVLRDADWLTRIDSHSVAGLGRLKPGVEMAQGTAELTLLTRRFEEEIHGPDLQDGAILTPSLMVPVLLRGFVRAFTGTLMGAVFLVLLIACANAANLQLARAVTRRQEMAVRSALGAKRGRLIRQLLTESVVLAALGGGLGLLISLGLTRLAGHLVPATLPIRLAVDLDWRVLSFTAVVSAITGILFGLAPALRGTRMDVADTLKDESRGTAAGRSRLAGILIAGQMALCLVLLLSAGLCLRSLLKASAFNPGFEVKERITAGFNLGDFGYSTAQAREFYTRLTERVRGLPGVQSAALASFLPLGTEHSNGIFQLEGEKPPGGESGVSFHQFGAGPGYFVTMGTKVLQGREFQETDREGTPRVVIINEEAARRYWPGRNPLGRRIYIGDVRTENAAEIVGIVQTGRYQTLGEDPIPVFYECFDQIDRSRATLVAHVRGNSQLGLAAIRRVTLELDPRLALIGATTLEQHLSLALFPVRTSSLLLGVLGLVALVLAVSGLFGVVAYSVSQRTREFGIRLALGAQRHDVLRLVLGQGLRLAAWGIVAGLFGAVGASHLLRNLLFGVGPLDPATFLAVPPLLLAVAWLACLIPALRASSLPPMTALRRE